jgi:hypothetical protein
VSTNKPVAIPSGMFGKDHWSTFGYIAHCVVTRGGEPQRNKMRVDPSVHLHHAHEANRYFPDKRYPTVLRGGVQVDGHDDYDCAEDLEEAGLIVDVGTGLHPCWLLTERGWRVWEEIQRAEVARVRWSQFQPSEAAMQASTTVETRP